VTASGDERRETSGPADTKVYPAGGPLLPLLEATLARGAEARFEVDGDSMLPLVRPRDVLRLGAAAADIVRKGDVVAVRGSSDSGVLVHRVVGRTRDRIVLKGDNCRRGDGRYRPEDVIGVVTRVERYGRNVWFGSGRWGWMVALAVRTGMVWCFDRVFYAVHRRVTACLKFIARDTRLRQHKGDDGNE